MRNDRFQAWHWDRSDMDSNSIGLTMRATLPTAFEGMVIQRLLPPGPNWEGSKIPLSLPACISTQSWSIFFLKPLPVAVNVFMVTAGLVTHLTIALFVYEIANLQYHCNKSRFIEIIIC